MTAGKGKIAIIGAGRLGLCLAVNLERSGYSVHTVDNNLKRVQEICDKELNTVEPDLNSLLKSTVHLTASNNITDIFNKNIKNIFVCVPTPSKKDGSFSTEYIQEVCDELVSFGHQKEPMEFIINSTVMPGDCDAIQNKMKAYNYKVSYNPEFIAQGSIIKDQLYPDQILIGSNHKDSVDLIKDIYHSFVLNNPTYSVMKLAEAEITKLAVNCFLTTKIAFANAIGDLTKSFLGEEANVLNAIGADSRIGNKFLKYGYGYGGPCLPRDNRALNASAKKKGVNLHISEATDLANYSHLQFQKEEVKSSKQEKDAIVFENVSYKMNSNIIEESQKLALAVLIARDGYKVTIKDNKMVIDEIEKIHGNLFKYELL
jgi:UDPglucose 6-dehydrogenase